MLQLMPGRKENRGGVPDKSQMELLWSVTNREITGAEQRALGRFAEGEILHVGRWETPFLSCQPQRDGKTQIPAGFRETPFLSHQLQRDGKISGSKRKYRNFFCHTRPTSRDGKSHVPGGITEIFFPVPSAPKGWKNLRFQEESQELFLPEQPTFHQGIGNLRFQEELLKHFLSHQPQRDGKTQIPPGITATPFLSH